MILCHFVVSEVGAYWFPATKTLVWHFITVVNSNQLFFVKRKYLRNVTYCNIGETGTIIMILDWGLK